MNLRHELKHEVSFADALELRMRLKAVMQQDSHAVNGKYIIRSLYFDNIYDKALLEKINGINMREKFRIRLYNNDLSFIMLEKKSKIDGLCKKEQELLTADEAERILSGDLASFSESPKNLVKELIYKMNTEGILPKTIVEYTREPFLYMPGNVRVTLDYNIRTGTGYKDFLDPDCVMIPARAAPVILEIKWDAFLPDVIRDIVQLAGVHTSAFSKYAACRMYG